MSDQNKNNRNIKLKDWTLLEIFLSHTAGILFVMFSQTQVFCNAKAS